MKQKLRGGRAKRDQVWIVFVDAFVHPFVQVSQRHVVGGCDEQPRIRTPSDAFYPGNEQHSTCSETTKLRPAGLAAPRLQEHYFRI